MHRFYFNPNPLDGAFRFEKPSEFKNLPKGLKEKRYAMTIREDKLTRSEKQNRYMWGVVYKYLSDETGYSPEEVHQLMVKRFLTYHKGLESFVQSTTKLSTKKMEDYLEDIRRFASMELHCNIPHPNESEGYDY